MIGALEETIVANRGSTRHYHAFAAVPAFAARPGVYRHNRASKHSQNSVGEREPERMKQRKLFCQLSPGAYRISQWKEQLLRRIRDIVSPCRFATEKTLQPLPVVVYRHNSLMRRQLGNTQPQLQENKVANLQLAAPKVNGVLIEPGEVFSFWKLVGSCTAKKGYREGVTISLGAPTPGVGGGMCQFTNLIHWMVLHTPLKIVEHHHHDGLDLFPDYGRQVPFGTGTSILYNYKDYRFQNNTDQPYQLLVWVEGEYLHGELRTTRPLPVKYHIHAQNEGFVREGETVYRVGQVLRRCVDKCTGNLLREELLKENHARVLYDTTGLSISEKKEPTAAGQGADTEPCVQPKPAAAHS